ncbi:hypothetical protein SAMN06295888_1464 [Desulfonatronum zhilinae]|nr:hypothetical protein SAMN06295888_1464 [Desulfonatronum zhilinae]
MDSDLLQRILYLNPWLKGEVLSRDFVSSNIPEKYVQRSIEREKLEASLPGKPKVRMIIGPRQAGKSTLAWKIFQNSGRFPLFLFCEDLLIRSWCREVVPFLHDLKELLPEPVPLFLEEAQHLTEAGLFLKGLVDLGTAQEIWVTGSSSFHLQAKTRESLAGRALRHTLLPFSLEETAASAVSLPPLLAMDKRRAQLARHLTYGGYPEVWFSATPEKVLWDLIQAFILRDASDMFHVRYPDAFRRLLKLLAFDTGNLLNMSNLAQECGVNRKTVQNYLDILEETHIIRRILPFQAGKRSEVTRAPKCYFVDNGIRNVLLGLTSEMDILERPDTGALVENWVLSELLKNLPNRWSVHYWRSTSKAEMDFVLSDGQRIIAVEVKAGRMARPSVSRSARSFLEAYAPLMLFVVNQALDTTITVQDRPVRFVPLEAAIPEIVKRASE